MGFYIIDEADIETHGCGSLGKYNLYKPNFISNDRSWAPRYVDRVSRMYFIYMKPPANHDAGRQ